MRVRELKSVCVFCGSNIGADAAFRSGAEALGDLLAKRDLGLVYGGGKVGLMGAIADASLAGGGRVIGVIPHGLERKELAHRGVTELHIVKSMHERKAMMAELSDAFVAMPGGLGTLEEIFEALTWAQLGIHHKPCGFLNIAGYYDALVTFLDHAVSSKLVRSEHRDMIVVDEDPGRLLEKLAAYRSPIVEKWIGADET